MSLKSILALVIIKCLLLSCTASAQEIPTPQGPAKEHRWLQKFVGEWDTTTEAVTGPDQPPTKYHGTIESKMIGQFWVVNRLAVDLPGVNMRGMQTIGYDSGKQKFVGTWVDSMMNHLWIYEGTLDDSGNKLTLEAEGPNMMAEGKTTKYRDAYEFKSPDHIVVTSSMLGEDGKWITFMTGESKRKKPGNVAK